MGKMRKRAPHMWRDSRAFWLLGPAKACTGRAILRAGALLDLDAIVEAVSARPASARICWALGASEALSRAGADQQSRAQYTFKRAIADAEATVARLAELP